jgi:hypothetical protein
MSVSKVMRTPADFYISTGPYKEQLQSFFAKSKNLYLESQDPKIIALLEKLFSLDYRVSPLIFKGGGISKDKEWPVLERDGVFILSYAATRETNSDNVLMLSRYLNDMLFNRMGYKSYSLFMREIKECD